MSFRVPLLVALALAAALPGWAQAPSTPGVAAPEALATAPPAAAAEPPDLWGEFMAHYYDVHKVDKAFAVRIDERLAYPHAYMKSAPMEIVDEDEKYVYLRNLPIEDPRSSSHKAWLAHEFGEARTKMRMEKLEGRVILDPDEVVPPPPFTDRLTLEERSAGLPTEGRWQMGFDVADFDGDGRLDLVLPPPRLGKRQPTIYLNRLQGWVPWQQAVWPQGVELDYGDAKVADFDGDGTIDIAIACHFKPTYVLYGNGKGNFTRWVSLPRINAAMTARALAVADFDRDGRPDLVQLAELDLDMASGKEIRSGLVVVNLNKRSGWQAYSERFPHAHYGDKVAVGDFNGDGAPDILTSNHRMGTGVFAFLNDGTGEKYAAAPGDQLPFQIYVYAVAAGRFGDAKEDSFLLGFEQSVRAVHRGATVNGLGLYRLLTGGKDAALASTLVSRDTDLPSYSAATVADLDGDGRLDIVAGRRGGRVEIFLQGSDGTFLAERGGEIGIGDAMVSELLVRDLDGDGRLELLVMATNGLTSPGSMRCYTLRRASLDKPAAGS